MHIWNVNFVLLTNCIEALFLLALKKGIFLAKWVILKWSKTSTLHMEVNVHITWTRKDTLHNVKIIYSIFFLFDEIVWIALSILNYTWECNIHTQRNRNAISLNCLLYIHQAKNVSFRFQLINIFLVDKIL